MTWQILSFKLEFFITSIVSKDLQSLYLCFDEKRYHNQGFLSTSIPLLQPIN